MKKIEKDWILIYQSELSLTYIMRTNKGLIMRQVEFDSDGENPSISICFLPGVSLLDLEED